MKKRKGAGKGRGEGKEGQGEGEWAVSSNQELAFPGVVAGVC